MTVLRAHRIPHRGRWRWPLALAGLAAVALLSAWGRPPAAPAIAASAVVTPTRISPVKALTYQTYFPILKFVTGVNIVNGGFENPNWYTDYTHNGSQWPYGWTFYATENGVVMPFPTKHQEGSIIPAIAGGYGEYVHKPAANLPKTEYPGTPRALIIDGWTTYKAFSAAVPQALRLSQVLTGTPGAHMQVTGYILGETFDNPTPPNATLEADHWVASVQLGGVADTRTYAVMIQRLDVPGNERPWNKFTVTALIPPSGALLLQVIVQQNWAGRTDFFIDAFNAYQLP